MVVSLQESSRVNVRRALVVDDDPDINRLVAIRLRRHGLDVEAAHDGQEALESLRAAGDRCPEIVFMDVSMPRLGGLEVLAHVRAESIDVAIVMMTAFGSENVAIQALRRGADDYLRKPLDNDEFVAVLERVIARIELRRRNDALRRQLETERAHRDRLETVLMTARTFEHEIGNKLATTVGYAEMLSRDASLSENARVRAAEVLRGAQESVEIMRRVLDLQEVEVTQWGEAGQSTIDVGSIASGRRAASS